MYWNHGHSCPEDCMCKKSVKYIPKCFGQLIPQYKTKKTMINAATNPDVDGINRVAVDGDLHTYISHEEVEPICYDCKRKDCSSINEKF